MKSARARSLVIFARAPESGKVKTRLLAAYSEQECLEIYIAMLQDAFALAWKVRENYDRISVYWATQSDSCPPPKDFDHNAARFEHFVQRGEDLGMRMYNAIADESALGSRPVVLIGCDSPHLPPDHLAAAAEMLETADVVLGPSEDGGYYLIGVSRPVREPFQGIPWGTSAVTSRTLEILKKSGLDVALLPGWYDLDTPADLERIWVGRDGDGCEQLRKMRAKIMAVRTK